MHNSPIPKLTSALAIAFYLVPILLSPAAARAESAKVGEVRSLPGLQTRARPPLLPNTLHLGMQEIQFFGYAKENNWAAITTIQRPNATVHYLQPGGEGLYALPDLELVYARGFTVHVYFEKGRLVGMQLLPDARDQSLTASEFITLARAWFPDDMLSVIYQVIPTDPQKRIVGALLGSLPADFNRDFGQASLPFCRTVVFPAPLPLNSSLSTCAQTASK